MSAEPLSKVILAAIMEQGVTDADGVRVCRIDAGKVLDAFSIISASMIATSPEAATAEGLKRVLRRQARRLESQVSEYRRVTAEQGSPFTVVAA